LWHISDASNWLVSLTVNSGNGFLVAGSSGASIQLVLNPQVNSSSLLLSIHLHNYVITNANVCTLAVVTVFRQTFWMSFKVTIGCFDLVVACLVPCFDLAVEQLVNTTGAGVGAIGGGGGATGGGGGGATGGGANDVGTSDPLFTCWGKI